MASENETFDEVLRCMQNDIVHFVGKPVKHSRDLLQEYHDRFKAAHRREVAELRGERNGILNANASLADDNDRLRREVAELERKVSELRECLKEAIREKCPFTRMSCKHGEPCDYECGTVRWRKVLKGSSND